MRSSRPKVKKRERTLNALADPIYDLLAKVLVQINACSLSLL
jgi:hypothetical protein